MNILIARTDRIGDTILTLPLAVYLKKKFPDSKIIFLAREYTKDVVELCSSVDKIICLGSQNFFGTVNTLIDEKIDIGILVNPKFKTAFLLWLASIKKRIGTKYRWYSFLMNHKVSLHRKYNVKHELEYNFDLLKPLEIQTDVNESNVDFDIRIDHATEQRVRDRLAKINIDFTDKIIILHIGSGGSAIDWNKNNFRELVKFILNELPHKILLTGSYEEFDMIQETFKDLRKNIYNVAGMFNLKELFCLFQMTELYIGNSTGPTHLAAAAGTNVIGFYPKVPSCSSLRWGPYTSKKFVFEPDIDCEDCTIEQCKKLNCMDSISVNEVFKKVKTILAN